MLVLPTPLEWKTGHVDNNVVVYIEWDSLSPPSSASMLPLEFNNRFPHTYKSNEFAINNMQSYLRKLDIFLQLIKMYASIEINQNVNYGCV